MPGHRLETVNVNGIEGVNRLMRAQTSILTRIAL
jgi:hypothetical protein